MTTPNVLEAQSLLKEAETLNPGPWIDHSYYVAAAAARIATHIPHLDADTAQSLGLLHDIGRRFGVTGMRHILDGYRFLLGFGYEQAARVALTHSFPVQNIRYSIGHWDCTEEDYEFVNVYLETIMYDDYDRLFQLCDALALPEGFCLLEKRFVDVSLRYGVNEMLPERWRATLQLQTYFEAFLGGSLYAYLPGVVRTTFGVEGLT